MTTENLINLIGATDDTQEATSSQDLPVEGTIRDILVAIKRWNHFQSVRRANSSRDRSRYAANERNLAAQIRELDAKTKTDGL